MDPLTQLWSIRAITADILCPSPTPLQVAATVAFGGVAMCTAPRGIQTVPTLNPQGEAFIQHALEHHVPIVIDTGASCSLTPYIHDFLHNLEPSSVPAMEGLNSRTRVVGQ